MNIKQLFSTDDDYKDPFFVACVIGAIIAAFVCRFANDALVARVSAYAVFVLCAFCAGHCYEIFSSSEKKINWHLLPTTLFFASAVVHIIMAG